jgi:uncharacterized protein (DUF2384 family)
MAADRPERLSFRLVIARHVCAMWGFSTEETERVLGVASSASVRDPLTREQQQRAFLVTSICETVDEFCPSADEADAWMREPQMGFGGTSALDALQQGSDGMLRVYRQAMLCAERADRARKAGAVQGK